MNKKLNIIISGGGTGGHIYPAIAIAKAILQLEPQSNILFIGAKGKMEMEKIPTEGFPIKAIDIIGLQRKLTLKNFLLPFYLLKSIRQVSNIFKLYQPSVVIGTGGYVSFPVLFTAQFYSIPTYIQEQNAFAGLANKLLSKKARKIFVAFEDMEKFFSKNKIALSGNPVRQDISNVSSNKTKSIEYFSLHATKPIILILGGSLGAKTMNDTIANNIDFFIQNKIQLIWQMGKTYYSNMDATLQKKLQNNYIYCNDFIYEMNLAYAAADIVVSRSGASTIAEIAMAGKPSILIPSPNVTNDHQTINALALERKQAAILIKDADAREQLIPQIEHLLHHPELQKNLSNNIQQFSKPNAATIIAQEILNHLN